VLHGGLAPLLLLVSLHLHVVVHLVPVIASNLSSPVFGGARATTRTASSSRSWAPARGDTTMFVDAMTLSR